MNHQLPQSNRAAAGDATPATRPVDAWRVCGEAVQPGPGGGCTCPPGGPSVAAARAAVARIGGAR